MAGGRGWGFLAGLVLGGLAGVAATIVFGPELDEETRRRLREEGLHWRERSANLTDRALTEASGIASRAAARADVLVALGRDLVDEQRARFREALEESKEAAAEKQRELEQQFERAEREGDAPL